MALGLPAADANSFLDTQIAGSFIQLHTGDPGASGTANVASNNTRKAVTWASASGGSKANSAQVQWTSIPATETYTHFSLWSLVTGGSFKASGDVNPDVAVAANGTATLTIAIGALTVTLNVAA